jgi:hypothetical protein
MSYLDDDDHIYQVDPGAVGTPETDLGLMLDKLSGVGPDAIVLVLDGFARLRAVRPRASLADCFHTSMIWYFG